MLQSTTPDQTRRAIDLLQVALRQENYDSRRAAVALAEEVIKACDENIKLRTELAALKKLQLEQKPKTKVSPLNPPLYGHMLPLVKPMLN